MRFLVFHTMLCLSVISVTSAGAGTVTVVSRQTGASGAIGNSDSGTVFSQYVKSPVTDDGTVFFITAAPLHPVLDENSVCDVYRRAGTVTEPISVSEVAPDDEVYGSVRSVSVANDGNTAVTLRPLNDLDGNRRAFVWDLTFPPYSRTDACGAGIDADSALISGNGLWVISSASAGIVAGDTNGVRDVFRYLTVTGTYQLVSVTPGGVAGNDESFSPCVSDDGHLVIFLSKATDLLGQPTSGAAHVFARNLTAGTTLRLGNRLDGTEPGACSDPAISGDGSLAAFVSEDPGFVAGDAPGVADVFVVTTAGTGTARISISTMGTAANAACDSPALNGDGRFVVFCSAASNLAALDTGSKRQVYLRDRVEGTTVLISQSDGGNAANTDCFAPSISAGGRYVTFVSRADNLVADTLPVGVAQVFLVDRGAGYLNRAPVALAQTRTGVMATPIVITLQGTDPDGGDLAYTIVALPVHGQLFDGDATGRNVEIVSVPCVLTDPSHRVTYVPDSGFAGSDHFAFTVSDAWTSSASSQVTISIGDTTQGVITRLTAGADGQESDGHSAPALSPGRIGISADGGRVCYASDATNLAPDALDTNSVTDVFSWSRDTSKSSLVSVSTAGSQGGLYDPSSDAAVSPCGRFVAFSSLAGLSNIDTNPYQDIYLRDLQAGSTTLVSVADSGAAAGNGDSQGPSVSDNAGFVVFSSRATNLTADSPGAGQVFMWERATGAMILVSRLPGGAVANADCTSPAISQNGAAVVFESAATNLAPNTNGEINVYVYWRATGDLLRLSVGTGRAGTDGDSRSPALSGSGRYVVFQSRATNLVQGDTEGHQDLFMADLQAGTIARISVDDNGNGNGANADCASPVISATGRFACFRTRATNLTGIDTGGRMCEYLVDLRVAVGTPGRIRLVSHGPLAGQDVTAPDGDSWNAALSADGRYVAFAADATNLVTGDGNGFRDVFIADFGERTNAPPTAQDVVTQVKADQVVTLQLPATDADGDDIEYEILTSPAHGTLGALVDFVSPDHPFPTVTYTPAYGHQGSDSFQVRIKDSVGAVTTLTVDITVLAPNRRPVLDLETQSDGVDYLTVFCTEVGGPVSPLNPEGLSVTDADDDLLVSAVVTITNPLDGDNEALAVTIARETRGITAHYESATGELLLTGDATPAYYQEVLRTLTYDNIATAPNTTPRAITFVVSDAVSESAVAVATVFMADTTAQIDLEAGWNLISLPTEPWNPDINVIFDRGGGERICLGPVWVWNGRCFEPASMVHAQQGCWVYVAAAEALVVSGLLGIGEVELDGGWNLVGPSVRCRAPANHALRGPYWRWDREASAYTPVWDGEELEAGQGYWIRAAEPVTLDLGEPTPDTRD